MPAPNLLNADRISIAYGTRTLLDRVSLGVARGDVVGVVGRNGDGKTTLLEILTGTREPDSGRVTHTGPLSIGYLHQADDFAAAAQVREVVLGDEPDHAWAADSGRRAVVEELLGDLDLSARVADLSGGERRRTALARLLLGGHDLLVLDEPTNHLDVEAVDWLAAHLRSLTTPTRTGAGTSLLVVSHDRWFLDAICSRIWEVHDGVVDGYDGGYAAYVLARAERAQQAAQVAARRQNLLRKELAWLRRGAPARTSKPRFRMDAANDLIADEPPPRDSVELQRFAVSRLGKDVFDLRQVSLRLPPQDGRVLLDDVSWSIGPGMRIGLVGVNGAGKTSLLRLLTGEVAPDRGTVKQGRTLAVGHLSQTVAELTGAGRTGPARVLDAVTGIRQHTQVAGGREVSATSLLEDFGFRGDKLTARLSDLSGGERRRLQLLRLLLEEPNVLLLDEPTNDLDIDTLTVVEDYLDSWPGTLIVVTHDRYFLERVCDVTYAMMGDGSVALLPGGVEQYLAQRRLTQQRATQHHEGVVTRASGAAPAPTPAPPSAENRSDRKQLARVEAQLTRTADEAERLHAAMVEAASDHVRLTQLQQELDAVHRRRDELETAWLATADRLG